MALPDSHTGPARPADIQAQGGVSVLERIRGKGGVIGAVLLVSVLGWLILWRMVSGHAALDGGFASLGPGMALIDDGIRMLGGTGLPEQGLWGDICRAFAVGGGAQTGTWPLEQFWIALAMWLVMAVAMMLPTAMPVMAAFDDIRAAAREKGLEDAPGWIFPAGYLSVWSALAVVAAALQWGLSLLMGEDPVFATSAPVIGGGVMIMAGLYQWSALKAACLSQCRSPMRFFMSHWRDGRMGAFRMGAHHGLFCVGCCWALMALMFVGGVMNLVWMAILTVIMLIEKILPHRQDTASLGWGGLFTYGTGIVFIVWGLGLMISGIIQIGLIE